MCSPALRLRVNPGQSISSEKEGDKVANLEALLESAPSIEGMKPCVLGRQIKELPDPYSGAVQGMLNNRELSADFVSFKLKSAGLSGSVRTIQIHRRGLCGCPSKGQA
jgi:hypothetical protein